MAGRMASAVSHADGRMKSDAEEIRKSLGQCSDLFRALCGCIYRLVRRGWKRRKRFLPPPTHVRVCVRACARIKYRESIPSLPRVHVNIVCTYTICAEEFEISSGSLPGRPKLFRMLCNYAYLRERARNIAISSCTPATNAQCYLHEQSSIHLAAQVRRRVPPSHVQGCRRRARVRAALGCPG